MQLVAAKCLERLLSGFSGRNEVLRMAYETCVPAVRGIRYAGNDIGESARLVHA
jgi:hypothetical protein